MGEIGNVKPGFHEGWQTRLWSIPVTIYNEDADEILSIVSVNEDEGFLVINVKRQTPTPEMPDGV